MSMADLAIFVLTTDNRHTNRVLYPLLRMRAHGVIRTAPSRYWPVEGRARVTVRHCISVDNSMPLYPKVSLSYPVQ
jgi:hypothetical protein